jgi:hypothetical protein
MAHFEVFCKIDYHSRQWIMCANQELHHRYIRLSSPAKVPKWKELLLKSFRTIAVPT